MTATPWKRGCILHENAPRHDHHTSPLRRSRLPPRPHHPRLSGPGAGSRIETDGRPALVASERGVELGRQPRVAPERLTQSLPQPQPRRHSVRAGPGPGVRRTAAHPPGGAAGRLRRDGGQRRKDVRRADRGAAGRAIAGAEDERGGDRGPDQRRRALLHARRPDRLDRQDAQRRRARRRLDARAPRGRWVAAEGRVTMRIAVYGTGGVGGYFGGRLAAAGEEVTFLASGAILDALGAPGLRADSIKGGFPLGRGRATHHPPTAGPAGGLPLFPKGWPGPGGG